MAMNLKQFRYVQILSQEGSFSRAADILNISQPSLSQYIKKIETQIGMELFTRLNGEVRLTDAGQIYLDAGRRILELEHQMENRFSDLKIYRGGTITIGISPYRSVHMIPAVLREFDRKYPDMKLVVKERSGGTLLEAARHGEFDLCVISLPVDDRSFACVPIQREETVIAVNRQTAFFQRLNEAAQQMERRRFPAVSISMAEGESFAMLDEDMLMRTSTDLMLERYGVRIREKVRLSSNEALLSIVNSGVCASFVPSGITGLSSEETAFFSLREETPNRGVGIIYRKDQYLSTPIRQVIRIFEELFDMA